MTALQEAYYREVIEQAVAALEKLADIYDSLEMPADVGLRSLVLNTDVLDRAVPALDAAAAEITGFSDWRQLEQNSDSTLQQLIGAIRRAAVICSASSKES